MINVVDVVYHCHYEYDQPEQVIDKHWPTIGFVEFVNGRVKYEIIRHMDYEGKKEINGVRYAFFKRKNAAWQIPFKTHNYIKSLKPDVVIIHGFIFPLQVIALKLALGSSCAIVLQHHGDKPVDSVRKAFQKIADRFVDAYLFTSAAIATAWLEQRIIRNKEKVVEILSASSYVEKMDKSASKQLLGLNGDSNYLWVGRLNENKDPVTVLKAFTHHTSMNPSARLFMIFQTRELLSAVKEYISNNWLHTKIQLVGKLGRPKLALWYNAADFYISASHEEATGYSLLEAMSVGCIPVVTSIPSFEKILGNKKIGFMFQPGDANGLAGILNDLHHIDIEKRSRDVEKYFDDHLRFQHIADNMVEICNKLIRVKH